MPSFPAVAANADGDVLVGYSLVSQAVYPSAAYSWIGAGGTGPANVVSWGVGPADGFTGYVSLDPGDGGVERWGDYSAAVADENGDLWFATETINQACTLPGVPGRYDLRRHAFDARQLGHHHRQGDALAHTN